MKIRKQNCTRAVFGRVTEIAESPGFYPVFLTVAFEVEGKTYTIKESMKLKYELIKNGKIHCYLKKTPKLGRMITGSLVSVSYHPQHPEQAYLSENTGIFNM